MMIFHDCANENEPYRREIEAAARKVLNSGQYVLGNELKAFESELANYCATDSAVGVGSGLDAITLILEAFKIQKSQIKYHKSWIIKPLSALPRVIHHS